jgi:hypothetical protein
MREGKLDPLYRLLNCGNISKAVKQFEIEEMT